MNITSMDHGGDHDDGNGNEVGRGRTKRTHRDTVAAAALVMTRPVVQPKERDRVTESGEETKEEDRAWGGVEKRKRKVKS